MDHATGPAGRGPDIDGMLEVVRTHLDMEVAFLAHVHEGRRILTHVSVDDGRRPDLDLVGRADPLHASLCAQVLAEPPSSPAFLADDVTADPRLAGVPAVADLAIRAYAGAPIVLPDGTVFGTLCTFASQARSLTVEDAHSLRLAAGLISHRLRDQGWPPSDADVIDLQDVFSARLRMVFQPIVDLRSNVVVGHEALARFEHEQVRGPQEWFDIARRIGVDVDLQQRTLQQVIDRHAEVPPDQYVSVNLSDTALVTPGTLDLLQQAAEPHRLVVEVLEHEAPTDEVALGRSLDVLRDMGIRVAMDDVGAGYAGLERVLSLRPDVIKLDRKLIDGVWGDHARQALVQAFMAYANAMAASVVAEGIENEADAHALRILGVRLGQGFLLCEPVDEPLARLPEGAGKVSAG